MSVRIFLILLLTLNSFSSQASLKWWEGNYLISGCRIFTGGGYLLKTFPGEMCQFFEDGSFLSVTQTHMRYFNKESEIKWEVPGLFHHQTNLSVDRKKILALDSTLVERNTQKIRVDKFVVLNLLGEKLFEQTADIILKQTKTEKLKWKLFLRFSDIADEELSHFNSFYEIPELKGTNHPHYLKAGNFVINSVKLGIYFLSPDLQKVLHHIELKETKENSLHDVQILSNGNMLYFNNLASGYLKSIKVSTIQEFDLKTGKIVFNFTGQPFGMFYSPHAGSVQKLDENHILFTHIFFGTYIYSKITKSLVINTYATHLDGTRIQPSQQVKAMKLDKFLFHWNKHD